MDGPSTSAGVKRDRSDVRGEESRKKKRGKVTKLMPQMTEMHSKKCGRKVFIKKTNVLKVNENVPRKSEDPNRTNSVSVFRI